MSAHSAHTHSISQSLYPYIAYGSLYPCGADGWSDGRSNGYTDGYTDGWSDGWSDGR